MAVAEPLTEEERTDSTRVVSMIVRMMEECEDYNNSQADDRQRFLNYYEGDMSEIAPEEGRSQAVSKDLRAVVRKLMPSIMRTLFGGDRYVEYVGTMPGQDEQAEQATDYVNRVVMPRCNGADALYDAIFDAAVLRTGILKWYAIEDEETTVYDYTGYAWAEADALSQQDGVEILEAADNGDGTVDFSARVNEKRTEIRLEAVPRSAFLIHPHEQEIRKNMMVGERTYRTRSELVRMGYDKAIVESLQAVNSPGYDEEDFYWQEDYKREFLQSSGADENPAMQDVLVYDLFVRLDLDGDGVAELYNIVLAESDHETAVRTPGGGDRESTLGYVVLQIEEADEAPYAKVVLERRAHVFDGYALSDDMAELQRIKTVLLRETLDNLYWQNTPQPAVDRSRVEDMDAVINPIFGKPIFLKPGANVRDALQWTEVPFIGDKSMEMLDYMDRLAKERTGITDLAGGVNPERFQEMSATGASIVSEAGTLQAEMVVRTLAKGGIRDAFKGLLRLVIAHTDRQWVGRRGDDWVQYDPRLWSADMDVVVNVGLGAGSKDKDLQILGMIRQMHGELFTLFGVQNPFVDADRIYNLLAQTVETAGFPSADPFFRRPTPEDVQALLQQAQQAQSNEGETAAKIQMKEMELQTKLQIETAKAERQAHVERAQLEADQATERSRLQSQQTLEAVQAVHARQLEAQKAQHAQILEDLRAENQRELEAFKADIELQMHRDDTRLKAAEIAARERTDARKAAIQSGTQIATARMAQARAQNTQGAPAREAA